MPGLTDAVRDRLRTILKIPRPMSLPRRGPNPGVGAKIFKDNVRMTVQAGLSRELWIWLVGQGWREIEPGENRYKYRALPSNIVTQLFDAQPDRWERLLAAAIRQAVQDTIPATVPARAVEAVASRD
jgi:hypothetical protein